MNHWLASDLSKGFFTPLFYPALIKALLFKIDFASFKSSSRKY
ncbi:MAG: hypothetical protein OFPII_20330 [Osedax symbiont Rs1]|nr:MAG: hypothetical protein OFPII_20330 [Osedax symbiont Rs1]